MDLGEKKQGWALKFLHDLGIWHKAHFFYKWRQLEFKSYDAHDVLASYYTQAVTHEVLYEPFLIS